MSKVFIIVVLGACTNVPATPTFQTDVAPILAARCVRCHGFPQISASPRAFRLDAYADTERPDGTKLAGAGSYVRVIASRVSARTMPPRFPLDDDQIEILQRWADEAPVVGPAPRGEPRAGNRPPHLVFDPVRAIYDLHDPDGDLVAGTLRASATVGVPGLVVATLHSGRDSIQFDPQRFPPSTYRLSAELDDGGAMVVVDVGTVEVH